MDHKTPTARLPALLNCQGHGNYPSGWYRQAGDFECEIGPPGEVEGHAIPKGARAFIDRAGHIYCAKHAPRSARRKAGTVASAMRRLDAVEKDGLLALVRVKKAAEICEMGLCNEPEEFARISLAMGRMLAHIEQLRRELESVAPR